MAYTGQLAPQQHGLAMAATLIAAILAGYGLLAGLDLRVVERIGSAISAVAIEAPEPPQPPPSPPVQSRDRDAGKASAANRHAKSAAIVAPKPKIIPPLPPTVAAAPVAGTGNQSSAGATPQVGPGTGAGGIGNGLGSGGSGTGTGSGGGKAVWRSGRIKDSDYPGRASRAKVGGVVEVRFTIQPSGRVTGCSTSRSSGDPDLDATTCRLIERRFRFKPATNASGDPVPSAYGWRQSWWLEPRR